MTLTTLLDLDLHEIHPGLWGVNGNQIEFFYSYRDQDAQRVRDELLGASKAMKHSFAKLCEKSTMFFDFADGIEKIQNGESTNVLYTSFPKSSLFVGRKLFKHQFKYLYNQMSEYHKRSTAFLDFLEVGTEEKFHPAFAHAIESCYRITLNFDDYGKTIIDLYDDIAFQTKDK